MKPSRVRMTWLVTGTSNGLGLAIAQHILSQNHNLISLSRHSEPHESLRSRIRKIDDSNPPALHHINHDLATPDQAVLQTKIREFLESHPEIQIDVLINNAAICAFGPLERFPQHVLERVMTVNFYSPLWLIQAVLPFMRRPGNNNDFSKVIVNVSSTQGVTCDASEVAYESSKFALEGMSGVLAKEVAEFGIRVLVVNLGSYRTAFALGDSTATATTVCEDVPILLDERDPYADSENVVRKRISLVQEFARIPDAARGDPSKAAQVICDAVMMGAADDNEESDTSPVHAVLRDQRALLASPDYDHVSSLERLVLGSDAVPKITNQAALFQKQVETCGAILHVADAG